MPELFNATRLDPQSVAAGTRYFDWGSQPRIQKRYPDFMFRYPLDAEEPIFEILRLARSVTERSRIGGKPYNRFNVPSAGNLHPVELYVQIRGVKGVLSGIYHVDALDEKLVLIAEIEGDGLEKNLGLQNRHRGLIFVVSIVPFRSEWKYNDRAWRYCWLDAGHQIAALETAAAATQRDLTFLSDFIPSQMNASLGFQEGEFCVAAAISAEPTQRMAKPLNEPAPYVQPTDYAKAQSAVNAALKAMSAPVKISPRKGDQRAPCKEAMMKRRSARTFAPRPLHQDEYSPLWELLEDSPLPALVVVHRCEGLQPGVYDASGKLLRNVQTDDTAALLVGQSIASEAAMTVVMLSDTGAVSDLLHAGMTVHALYLECTSRNVGVSGIGAYYDDLLRAYLQTEREIAYVAVVGAPNI